MIIPEFCFWKMFYQWFVENLHKQKDAKNMNFDCRICQVTGAMSNRRTGFVCTIKSSFGIHILHLHVQIIYWQNGFSFFDMKQFHNVLIIIISKKSYRTLILKDLSIKSATVCFVEVTGKLADCNCNILIFSLNLNIYKGVRENVFCL